MTNTPNLTKLDFSDIKLSLTDYLKNQSVFSGYNFDGSTIQTLIDLLAYNTYYYAFYSNMISNEAFLDSAQRVNSIVSLVKPLGYTIPGLKSATSNITVNVDVPAHTKFNGVFGNGTYYSFYNPEIIPAGVSGNIIEGTFVNKTISNSVNTTNQSYLLDETDVDISTVRIYVTPSAGDEAEWTSINHFPNNAENVFYIERDGNIFTIQFGKENTLGKSIESTDTVRITYLISSGVVANGINSFSSTGFVISDIVTSSGGNDGPDINLIKFAAPKIFSSQDRAITKNDYYGLLSENDMFTDTNDIVVYGGDEVYPPKYGRVFVSYDPTASGTPSTVEIVEFLKTKNTLTIVPEHVTPKKIDVDVSITVIFKSGIGTSEQNTIKTDISSIFQTHVGSGDSGSYKFNNLFSFSDFKSLVLDEYSDKIATIFFNHTTYKMTANNAGVSEFSIENGISLFNDESSTIANISILDVQYNIIIPQNSGTSTVPLELWGIGAPEVSDIDIGAINTSTGYLRINSVYHSEAQINIKTSDNNVTPIQRSLSTFTLLF